MRNKTDEQVRSEMVEELGLKPGARRFPKILRMVLDAGRSALENPKTGQVDRALCEERIPVTERWIAELEASE